MEFYLAIRHYIQTHWGDQYFAGQHITLPKFPGRVFIVPSDREDALLTVNRLIAQLERKAQE